MKYYRSKYQTEAHKIVSIKIISIFKAILKKYNKLYKYECIKLI